MLALDIETMGLLHEVPLPEITCVCLYDGTTKTPLQFMGLAPEAQQANAQRLIQMLSDADSIAGFNAPLFDLEYIRRQFAVGDDVMREWVLKCIDPFMTASVVLGHGCKLQTLLANNGLPSKTGTGGNAIELAREGRWPELIDYCMMDTVLTHALCSLPWIAFAPLLQGRHRAGLGWEFALRYTVPGGGELNH